MKSTLFFSFLSDGKNNFEKIKNMDKYKNIKTKENYEKLLASGMFWEFHPELTGNWEQDKLIINK